MTQFDTCMCIFHVHPNLFFQLRLGNGADTPLVGDLVLSTLCPALSHIISNGMKPHLAGFQMFGRVQVTIWKVVEASVETGRVTLVFFL